MSLSKFRIDNTGEVFLYDNDWNTILDSEGKPLGIDNGFEFQEPRYHKSDKPTTIKVILGHACNYNCSYCVQKDIGNPDERPKNIMTKELIKKINKHLDLSDISRIELWGGETLLYWKDIIEVIGALDRPGLQWFIPTNGTLLRMKHVEYFKQMQGQMTLGISHDGPGHEEYRGPEFLQRKVEEFRALQEANIPFSFNAVITKTNYDLFAVDKYFRDFLDQHNLKHTGLVFEVGRTYEKGECKTDSPVIPKDKLPHYREILKAYFRRHAEILKDPKSEGTPLLPVNLFHFSSNSVLSFARSMKFRSPIHHYATCGTDDPNLIVLDMNGNLRTCQNVDESYIIGNVINIKDVTMKNVDYRKDGFCDDCSVKRLCKSSCPIDLPFESFLQNHMVENVHYGEIQLAGFELLFNSPITKL